MTKRVLALLLLVGMAGCATTEPAMVPIEARPVMRQTEGAGVRVGLVRVFGDIITCQVVNLGKEPVVVDRDAIEMITATGEHRGRLAGGAGSTYGIPGAGSQVVNLRYDLGGVLDDEVVQLDFSHAIVRNGQPVAVPPLAIRPLQQTL
jgi:hypothetical protein